MVTKILNCLPARSPDVRNVQSPSDRCCSPKSTDRIAKVGPFALRELAHRWHATQVRHNGFQLRPEVVHCLPGLLPALSALELGIVCVHRSRGREEFGNIWLDPVFATTGCRRRSAEVP